MEIGYKYNSLTKSDKNKVEGNNPNESRENIDTKKNVGDNNSSIKTNINIIKAESINDIKKEKILDKEKSLEKIKDKNNNYLNLKRRIKSRYIIKKIFLNLNDKKKLILIRYNKFYKELLGINIELYKKISGTLKIGEANGYGKEYNLSYLYIKFKGYYKNQKRNGKGKEYYDNGKLKFEGEYINGIKNGKGIEYDYNANIIFVGEYKDGKKWNGKIKEINNGNLIFEGEYLEGKKIGIEYDNSGNIIFEGEYLDEKRWNGVFQNKENNCSFIIKNGNGKVKEYSKYGLLIFEGEYLNGVRWNGKLKEYSGFYKEDDWFHGRNVIKKSKNMRIN